LKLRSYLIALALLAVMPVALFGAIVVAFQVAQQRDTFVRGVDERTLAMMTAVDSKLGGALATLTALAQVQSLRDGDVALFRASAQSVLATQEDWVTVNLALPSGQQVMNVRARGPGPLPAIAESQPLLARVVRDRQPIVGELLQGPVTRRWDFAVRVFCRPWWIPRRCSGCSRRRRCPPTGRA
jgi:hypothetical protein